jgi:multiple antibiotic resistance protein
VSDLVAFFGLALTALLPLINPLGGALIFLGLVGAAPSSVYWALSKKIAISTTLFLIVVEGVGTAMLKLFGISLPVMQVSGGLVIAAMGWNLLNQNQPQASNHRAAALDDTSFATLESKVFYPLTFPITAGPGCIVVMVTLSAHASVKGAIPDLASHAGIVLAVAVLSVLVYACYGAAPVITARIRPQTVHGLLRVIAFVLMCIGVQITWNGAEALLKTLLRP